MNDIRKRAMQKLAFLEEYLASDRPALDETRGRVADFDKQFMQGDKSGMTPEFIINEEGLNPFDDVESDKQSYLRALIPALVAAGIGGLGGKALVDSAGAGAALGGALGGLAGLSGVATQRGSVDRNMRLQERYPDFESRADNLDSRILNVLDDYGI